MSKNLLFLLKIRFISRLKLNTFRREKEARKKKHHIFLSSAIGLVISLVAIYCGLMAYGLQLLDLRHLIPVYSFSLCTLLSFFLTLFKVNGDVFAYRDYDILMALPIKTSTIIASRFSYLYIWNTGLSAIIMLPMGGVYAVYETPDFKVYLLWLASLFLVSLIPMVIATAVGSLIVAIASKSKHSSFISSLLTMGLILGFALSSLFTGGIVEKLEISQLDKIYNLGFQRLSSIYPIAKWFHRAIREGDVTVFLLYCLLSMGLYIFFVVILSRYYRKINTGLMTHSVHRHFDMQPLRQSNVLRALYSKELNRFWSSSIYVTNIGTGAILGLVFAIGVAVMGVDRLVELTGFDDLKMMLPRVGAFALAGFVSMTCSSCVSLSMEGKNVWILQSLPIRETAIYLSKILVNLTITIPVSILGGVLLAVGSKANFSEAVLLVLVPLGYSIFTAIYGILVNHRYVTYEWESETQVVKQSVSALVGLMGGLCLVVITGSVAPFLSGNYYTVYGIGLVLLLGLLSGLLYKRLEKKTLQLTK